MGIHEAASTGLEVGLRQRLFTPGAVLAGKGLRELPGISGDWQARFRAFARQDAERGQGLSAAEAEASGGGVVGHRLQCLASGRGTRPESSAEPT